MRNTIHDLHSPLLIQPVPPQTKPKSIFSKHFHCRELGVGGRITHCLKNTLFDNCTRPAVLRTSQCWEVESCSLGLLGALEDTLFCVGDCQSVDEYIRWLGAESHPETFSYGLSVTLLVSCHLSSTCPTCILLPNSSVQVPSLTPSTTASFSVDC